MRYPNYAALAVLLILSLTAKAAEYPEDGWWWNPQAPGRGYMIERQDDVMFIATLQYADDGPSEWLTIQGTYTPEENPTTEIGYFIGDTFERVNGQCIGCPYEAPITSDSAQGVATVSFTTNQTGVLSWEGETIAIERTFWAFRGTLDQLDGDWAMSSLTGGVGSMQLIRIENSDNTSSTVSDLSTGEGIGSIFFSDSTLSLNLADDNLTLPIKMPETNRFYAGQSTVSETQVVATRVDDVPLATSTDTGDELPMAFSAFGPNVTVVANPDDDTVTLEAAGRPDHTTPYWDPDGTSGLHVDAGPETDHLTPGYIDRFTDRYFLTVPVNPELAASPTNTGLGAIGIAITGAPIFNDQEGPNRDLDEPTIAGLDAYGAHTGPQVYHYHLEPTPISNDDNKLFAILRDGFFLYGRRDWPSNEHPTDLDASGGHVGLTQYSPTTPVYHYHIKNQLYATVNGRDAYLLFDEAYQGTPNNITN